MKKIITLLFLSISIISQAQYTLIEPQGNNGIISKHNGTILSDPGVVNFPEIGWGTRLMWIPAKSAFRVGTVQYNLWDPNMIGTWSFAAGFNPTASGQHSVAIGYNSYSTGNASIAFTNGKATGAYSLALNGGEASGTTSLAWGGLSKAIGNYSMAMGFAAETRGIYSTAIGNAKSYAEYAVAIGTGAKAKSQNSTAIGFGAETTAPLTFSYGLNTVAHSWEMTALGMNNDTTSNPGAKNSNLGTQPLLVVGNGTNYMTDRKNALMILRNGNMGIMNSNPTEALEVNGNGKFAGMVSASCGVLTCSDIRFKKNLKNLENSLSKIGQLKGVSYEWRIDEFPKRKFNDKNQIGLIAQDVEGIFPELVHTDKEGYKSVDYAHLTPVLVEAIKELSNQVKTLQDQNKKLEASISSIFEILKKDSSQTSILTK
jgi:Chaperone of endosialidase/Head domain of trimeric autotransporter adhesin